jgi:hypothetical protein
MLDRLVSTNCTNECTFAHFQDVMRNDQDWTGKYHS